ncbi:MAG: lipocalin-like domain-containing protein [Candidatus Acidiferrum sp.]
MPKTIIAVVLAIVSFQSPGAAQTRDKLMGTWKLVSAKITTDKGEVRDSWGPNPAGFLTYTEDGRMSALLTLGNRKPLSVSDFISAPEAERAEAFASMTAYAGKFTFTGNKVIHHVEAASMPNDVGSALEREVVELNADRLVLRVAKPYLRGGMMVRSQELTWKRIK